MDNDNPNISVIIAKQYKHLVLISNLILSLTVILLISQYFITEFSDFNSQLAVYKGRLKSLTVPLILSLVLIGWFVPKTRHEAINCTDCLSTRLRIYTKSVLIRLISLFLAIEISVLFFFLFDDVFGLLAGASLFVAFLYCLPTSKAMLSLIPQSDEEEEMLVDVLN